MTSADSSQSAKTGYAILEPYRHDPNSRDRRRARFWAIGLLSLFCLFWGLVWSFIGTALILVLMTPILILAVLVIWALPDLKTAPTRVLERFFFLYLLIEILWPNYISFAIPHSGIPWISLARLAYAPMALVFLICLAVSQELRSRLWAALKTERPIFWLVVAFMGIVSYSVILSDRIFYSMDKWVDNEITLGCMFFASCWVFTQPGRVIRWARILWACAVITGLIGLWEWRLQHVPWYGHLPAFLQMDPDMATVIAPTFRAAAYRVRSTFQDALGLGEYMSLTIPFLLCFGFGPFSRRVRYGAFASVLFLCGIVVMSGARSGMLGVLIDFALFGFFQGFMYWRRNPKGLIGPAIVLSYPILAAGALVASFLIGRIRVTLWESGATSASNLGRQMQYASGIPKVLSHPFGYGIGRAAETLGFYTLGGQLTIDTYYLSIALDFGVIGFVVFYGLIAYSAFTAGKHALVDDSGNRETAFFPAAAISLIAFLAIKSVYSEPVNHPLFFMIMGMIPALVLRVRQSQTAPTPADPRAAVMGGGPRIPMRPAHQPQRP
jgi:hypothetical protein